MNYNTIISSSEKIDEKITLIGWVNSVRHHSKVSFCDLRDKSSKIQVVFTGSELLEKINSVSVESVVEISGKVVKRKDNLTNPEQTLGHIELFAESINIVSLSEVMPFPIGDDTRKIDEKVRMQYRYLDLRSKRMQKNIRTRHNAVLFLRNYYSENGFIEIETPQLTKGTPEGAREFIVPSRIHKGTFFVLPQSPQQFKQLLMVGGMERYFQVARCFRDEDQRQDRQPEFTQWDIEMSFVDEDDIMQMVEKSIISLVEKVFPDKIIAKTPFPRITHTESMEKYGNDKPEMRKEKDENTLAFCWVTQFPLFEKADTKTGVASAHHPFTMPLKKDIDKLKKEPLSVRSTAFDLVLNGYEIGSGSVRIHDAVLQKEIFSTLGLTESEIEEKFGHMLKAFSFGVPPHGGVGLGLDRLLSLIIGEDNIREVIAFPKTGEARDLLMGAPNSLPDEILRQAGIEKIDKD